MTNINAEATTGSTSQLGEAARAYLAELAAEIVANGDPTGDLATEMQAAHERRQQFAREMAEGTSDRARVIRRILSAKVWGSLVAHDAHRRTLASLEMEADEVRRQELLADIEREHHVTGP